MFSILLDKVLHFLRAIVDAISGEGKAIGIEPMVVSTVHLHFEIIAYLIYQIYLQERLTADKVPNDTFLFHIILMIEDIVYSSLSYLPGHSLFRVLTYEVAVFASELAVLGDNEGDILGHAILPSFSIFLYASH